VNRRQFPRRDERGQSVSILVILVMAAMIFTAGLVIDGGQQAASASRAEAAAAGAARAAGNAAATQELADHDPAGSAVIAAHAYLAGQPDVAGTVTISAGVVHVRTSASSPTILLSLLGLDSVTGTGSADADLVPTGKSR
jgi:hypothetical protein